MTASLAAAVFWALAATATAFLPMRLQYAPGLTLLIAAPLLIVWIGIDYGWIAALLSLAAFVSMFRHPLSYFWRKWRGQETEGPR